MARQFTVNDVQSVTDACHVMGVEQVWCRILFNGCENPHEFLAHLRSSDPFVTEMYQKLQAGHYGELVHGTSGYATQPKEQPEVEAEVINKRNQLLLESDFSDLPATQARLSDSQKLAWATYRQALRDLPAQGRFPWDPVWPTKP